MFSKSTILTSILLSLSLASALPTPSTPLALRSLQLNVNLPGVSLAIAAKLNGTNAQTIPDADRARAKRLRLGPVSLQLGKRETDVDVQNTAVTYTATVNVGSPATAYTLLIDTGSSNTWVGADKPYTPTSHSHDTGKSVSVTYGGGSFSGEEWMDRVDLGNGLLIDQQSIGVAKQQQSFGNGIDGILGVGPQGLTRGTLSSPDDTVPTIIDNLASAHTIPHAALGFFYAPYVANVPGVLTFGGADSSLYTGALGYVGLTGTYPASAYWGVDQSVEYDGQKVLGEGSAGIVDSGTTMIMLASDAFQAYQQATGATLDSKTGFLKLPSSQYSNLKPLNFNIGGTTYALSPNGQIWPRTLNSALGGDSDSVYLVIADIGTKSGSGLDFINGYFFMERFYTVFDTENSRVGFATTKYTDSTVN